MKASEKKVYDLTPKQLWAEDERLSKVINTAQDRQEKIRLRLHALRYPDL